MKTTLNSFFRRASVLTAFLLFLCIVSLQAAGFRIRKSGWDIRYQEKSKTLDFVFRGDSLLLGVYPMAKYRFSNGKEGMLTPDSFPTVHLERKPMRDKIGRGTLYTFLYRKAGLPTLRHLIYAYADCPYLLTELVLDHDKVLGSNFLSPIATGTTVSPLGKSPDNRVLMVPWDNDAWVRYESNPLKGTNTSYEATALYDGQGRSGLVLGSVDHDTWKSAIRTSCRDNRYLDSLVCYSGASGKLTRDVLPHGEVRGTTVRSARMFLGFFRDWRSGLETYGRVNARLVPPRTWNQGAPFGWNSWGVMAEKLSFAGAMSVSDFYRDSLQVKGFRNGYHPVVIDLDSFWDNLSESQLQQFASHCLENGQLPGIYWGPFSDWGGDGERFVEGTNQAYRYKDCYLQVRGGVHTQGGRCLDPTHPATLARIRWQMERFRRWGFRYVKLDFITNGAVQGDSYYNPQVTTGTQAYNLGMDSLRAAAGKDLFLSLSIAPLFPYEYGNSRRMCCDSWANIGNTQYVMNALSFGWWTNQLYRFNDPDHLVLQKEGTETMGENRARVTTGAISGMFLFGDNFSAAGPSVGFPEKSRERAMQFMTNRDINELAALGRSFRPVEGRRSASDGAENLFVLETDRYVYLACLNYGATSLAGSLPLERLGLTAGDVVQVRELWLQAEGKLPDSALDYEVPPADARVYRLTKR